MPPTLFEVLSEGPHGEVERFHIRRHSELIVLRDDIDVSVAWGMDMDPSADATGRQPLTPDWAEQHDWKLTYYFADLRYRGEVVDRYTMISVDGGRAIVPAGTIEVMPGEGAGRPAVVRVSDFHYQLARLLHGLTSGDWSQFDRYFGGTEIIRD